MPVPTFIPAPPFTLEVVLDLLGAPSKIKEDLVYQDTRRLDLRRHYEYLSNSSTQTGQLPPPTSGIQNLWNAVVNIEIPRKRVWDLYCSDAKIIAEALKALYTLDDRRLRSAISTLSTHADMSATFAVKTAELISECLRIHYNHTVVQEIRRSVCANELEKLEQFWAADDDRESYTSYGVRGWDRLMFFGALFDYGVATVVDYAQVLNWITSGGTPCAFRLRGVKIVVEAGDQRALFLCKADADLILDVLRTIEPRKGSRAWALGGHQGAAKMLKAIRQRTEGWRKD